MKNSTKIILCMLIISVSIKSQDTIAFKNKTIVSVKISEVGIKDIKYLRTDNLNGPSYISSKSDIVFIKYGNGVVDSIKEVSDGEFTMMQPYKCMIKEQLKVVNNKFLYEGKAIGNRGLKILIDECSDEEKKNVLISEYKKMKLYRMNRSIYPPVLFVSSMCILVSTSPLVRSNQSGPDYTKDVWDVAGAGIVGAALVRITGFVIDKVNKNKLNHQRYLIASIYNDIN